MLGVLTYTIDIMLSYLYFLLFYLKQNIKIKKKIYVAAWKPKTLQQITGLVINFFQNNQNFDSGKKSVGKYTDLTSNQTEPKFYAS